jgi:AraC-like DNA-binding protein
VQSESFLDVEASAVPDARRLVIALVVERDSRARIVDALRGRAAIDFCDTNDELLARASVGRSAAVILSPRDGAGASTADCVGSLREAVPARPVLAYCDVSVHNPREILEIVRAGASDLVLHGHGDSPVTLRAAIERAHQDSARDRVLRGLRPELPSEARGIVEYCVTHARNDLTVDGIAAALRVHRRTLTNRLARAGYPPPRVTIAWTCLLVAAALLEDPSRTVERIALELEYPSATAFRNALKRHTGLRPSEVRENGGLAYVLHIFAVDVKDRGHPVLAV